MANSKVITLEATREGYSIEQVINKTITVGELIECLKEFEPEDRIVFSNDNGYTFGSISENALNERNIDEE